MRIANHDGRLVLVSASGKDTGVGVDVETASGGKFSADPQAAYENWDQFRDWAAGVSADASVTIERALLGPPVPKPRQVFAIGLNYHEHAAESKMIGAAVPPTFTKFPTCLTGPYARVELQDARTSQMILNVPQLVVHLSSVLTLLPGDIIFTGTPSGVGQARDPQRFITPGCTLVSGIEGLGQIETKFVA